MPSKMTERAPCLLCGKEGTLDTSGAFPVLTHDPGDVCTPNGIQPAWEANDA